MCELPPTHFCDARGFQREIRPLVRDPAQLLFTHAVSVARAFPIPRARLYAFLDRCYARMYTAFASSSRNQQCLLCERNLNFICSVTLSRRIPFLREERGRNEKFGMCARIPVQISSVRSTNRFVSFGYLIISRPTNQVFFAQHQECIVLINLDESRSLRVEYPMKLRFFD